jgi:hypothetical protein
MKGDKGVCVAGIIPNQVRRTKFDTEAHATEAMNMHIGLGFVAADFIVYKCKECGMYHFGKPLWKQLYGK